MNDRRHIPPDLLNLARENPCGELAWQHPTILKVASALAAQGHAILGGDVMHDEDGKLDYFRESLYFGNWYRNWRPEAESWAEFVAESLAVTARYIEAYVQRNDDSYWYVPVFATEGAVSNILARRL